MSLQRLHDLDRSSIQFSENLDKLLHEKEYVDGFQNLPEGELVQLVNYLNNVLDRLDCTSNSFRKCLHVLQKICHSRKILPATYELAGVRLVSDNPPAHGGFSDAYKGKLVEDVCVKQFRITAQGDREKVKELFCKEAIMWKRLNHPNIVPFKGIKLDPLQLISEWMPGGELREYIRENQPVNLVNLLLGIAEGLEYLHLCNVIHGDLKGPNIVVDALGNPRITDFGLAAIVRGPDSLASITDDQGHTPRWTAPEVLRQGSSATKESDVFSFGMVITEVFTGKVPFSTMAAPEAMVSIMGGKRPTRPSHPDFTEPLWALTRRCWHQEPRNRPEVREVIKVLRELSADQVTKLLPARGMPPERGADGGRGVAPYEVDTPSEPTLPPPPSSGRQPGSDGNDSSANGSTTQIVSERELRERSKKEKEAMEPKEKLEKEKQNETPKEKTPKPHTESATPAPIQNEVIPTPAIQESFPGDGNDNGETVHPVAGSNGRVNVDKPPPPLPFSPTVTHLGPGRLDPDNPASPGPGNVQSGRSGDPTLLASPVEIRRNQRADKPTNNPRNLHQSTRHNHGRTVGSPAPTSRLPGSASVTEQVPRQKKHGTWCQIKKFCCCC